MNIDKAAQFDFILLTHVVGQPVVVLICVGERCQRRVACVKAVLQKHREGRQEHSFAVLLLRLDSNFEQFCNERCLAPTVSFVHPLYLSFPYHVHDLISL